MVNCLAVVLAASLALASSVRAAIVDPLTLYAGAWTLAMDGAAKTSRLENHCAKTGRFYVCEQLLDGNTAAMVVFLPVTTPGPAKVYRTQTLRPDATKPDSWSYLTIVGDLWTYSPTDPAGPATPESRVTNRFLDPDHIRFEVQTSKDGKRWTTTAGGDERRLR